jgi:hypothetical protein
MEIVTLPRRRPRESVNERHGKALGLVFIDDGLNTKMNIWTFCLLFIIFCFFIAVTFGNPTHEFLRFIISQYLNISLMTISLRSWWIYACHKSDSATVISVKIVVSSTFLLFSSALSLLTLIFMHR